LFALICRCQLVHCGAASPVPQEVPSPMLRELGDSSSSRSTKRVSFHPSSPNGSLQSWSLLTSSPAPLLSLLSSPFQITAHLFILQGAFMMLSLKI
jgi:hypothetical protein